MLELQNLEYEILRDKVVRDFSLKVGAGEVVTLFGASGCGKTTILRLISGLIDPRKGKIINKFNNEKAVLELFARLGLTEKDALKYPDELSGGMRQRVAFVRAIVTKPDLLLMDEPFSGLDYDMKEILIDIVTRRVEEGMSVVLVTHDRMEAARMSSKICFLASKGAVIERELELDRAFSQRDFAYASGVIDANFKGKIYYD